MAKKQVSQYSEDDLFLEILNFTIHLAATSYVLRIGLQKSAAPSIQLAVRVNNVGFEEQCKQVEL